VGAFAPLIVRSLRNIRPVYSGPWRKGTVAKPGMVQGRIDVDVRLAITAITDEATDFLRSGGHEIRRCEAMLLPRSDLTALRASHARRRARPSMRSTSPTMSLLVMRWPRSERELLQKLRRGAGALSHQNVSAAVVGPMRPVGFDIAQMVHAIRRPDLNKLAVGPVARQGLDPNGVAAGIQDVHVAMPGNIHVDG
jgi:hypothetical protein